MVFTFSIGTALGIVLGFALSVLIDYIDRLYKNAKKDREQVYTPVADNSVDWYEALEEEAQLKKDEPPEINNLPWGFGGSYPTTNTFNKPSEEVCECLQPAKDDSVCNYERDRQLDRERDRENEAYYRQRQEDEAKRYNALEIIRLGRQNVPYELVTAAEKVMLEHLTPKPNIELGVGTLPRRKGLLEGFDKPFNLDEAIEKIDSTITPSWTKDETRNDAIYNAEAAQLDATNRHNESFLKLNKTLGNPDAQPLPPFEPNKAE